MVPTFTNPVGKIQVQLVSKLLESVSVHFNINRIDMENMDDAQPGLNIFKNESLYANKYFKSESIFSFLELTWLVNCKLVEGHPLRCMILLCSC